MEKWFRVSAEASSSSSMMPPPPPSPYEQATSNHQQQYCFQLNSLPADISNKNIPNYQLADDNHEYEARMKSKIMAHPLFPRLMASYVNCQKVGAPPEAAARLEAAAASILAANSSDVKVAAIDSDPELDQFMEAYCEMLAKYHQELAKPFQEAMLFLSSIDSQLKALSVSAPSYSASSSDVVAQSGSSEEAGDHVNRLRIDPQSEDREIKAKLLVKYGQSLGSLRQEFIQKKKNGKLPKPARLKLQEWWSRHSRWPYPSESQKLALVESTGLGLKQINNWFINQRKRHWKPPTEDMQFSMMDAMVDHYQNYMDNRVCNPGYPMDFTSDPLI